jgi:hypothetical protein
LPKDVIDVAFGSDDKDEHISKQEEPKDVTDPGIVRDDNYENHPPK